VAIWSDHFTSCKYSFGVQMEKSKGPIVNGSEAINAFASSAYILSQLIIGLACVPLSNILKASSPRAFGGAGTLHRRRQGAQNTFLPAAATTPRCCCCCAGSLSFRFMAEHVCMEISGRPQRTNERSSLA
jgi:hypothetical protein